MVHCRTNERGVQVLKVRSSICCGNLVGANGIAFRIKLSGGTDCFDSVDPGSDVASVKYL